MPDKIADGLWDERGYYIPYIQSLGTAQRHIYYATGLLPFSIGHCVRHPFRTLRAFVHGVWVRLRRRLIQKGF